MKLFWAPCIWLFAGLWSAHADIKIGEISPLSGNFSQFGTGAHHGYELAFQAINANGGVLGQKLDLISEDSQSKPGQSSVSVRKLITQDKVVAILGEVTSSASLEAAPIAQESRIPMITPTATNPRVTQIGDYIFRICFLDELQGRIAARFAAEKLKLKKAVIFTDLKQDYSVDLARFFKEQFTAEGGNIVGEQSYSSNDTDFRAQLTTIRARAPDLVFLPGYYPEVSLILKQARQIGLKMPFVGCDGWANQTLLDVGGKAVNGCCFTNHFAPDDPNPLVRNFVTEYKSKYGMIPDTFAALGYDDARLMADAIKRAGSVSPAAIRDAIAATKGFEGVTGEITMDASRNASKPGFVIQVKDGKFQVAEKISPQ